MSGSSKAKRSDARSERFRAVLGEFAAWEKRGDRRKSLVCVEWHRRLRGELGAEARGVAGAKLGYESARFLPLGVNRNLVIVVIGERRMDIRQSEVRVGFHDLVWRHAELLGLTRDEADLDVGAGDHWTPAGGVNVCRDFLGGTHHHQSKVARPPSVSSHFLEARLEVVSRGARKIRGNQERPARLRSLALSRLAAVRG